MLSDRVAIAWHGLSSSSYTDVFVVAMYLYHLLAAHGLAEPVLYLKDFGRAHTDVQDCVRNAEKFMVQVVHRGNHGIETMDRLRFNWYHHRKSTTITDVPQIVTLQKH